MRHRKSVKKLGRTATHRKATLANLSAALFMHKHIKTTEAKAKETRRVSEKLITLAKKDTIHARRLALKKLRHKNIVHILFSEIASQYADRTGGYTRVIKLGQRSGDGARMAVLELVGFEMATKKKKAKEKEKEAKADVKRGKKVKDIKKTETKKKGKS
jgi:large subunit ribosomal protein L17